MDNIMMLCLYRFGIYQPPPDSGMYTLDLVNTNPTVCIFKRLNLLMAYLTIFFPV